jgi:hypothetical protein
MISNLNLRVSKIGHFKKKISSFQQKNVYSNQTKLTPYTLRHIFII